MDLTFIDNPVIEGREHHYVTVRVRVKPVLKSWRDSLFSFEWLQPDLSIRAPEDLPEGERLKRQAIEADIKNGRSLEIPILGIGLLDNVEIGSGKALFLTLAALGAETIPVHIPAAHAGDFKHFADGV